MEWFWNGFWGGLGYAVSGIVLVACVVIIFVLGAFFYAVVQASRRK